jgi:hypothetical protein
MYGEYRNIRKFHFYQPCSFLTLKFYYIFNEHQCNGLIFLRFTMHYFKCLHIKNLLNLSTESEFMLRARKDTPTVKRVEY